MEEEPEQDTWLIFLEAWRGTEPIDRLDRIEPARHRFSKLMSRQERVWAVRFARAFRDELRAKGRKYAPTMSVALWDKFWQAYVEDEERRHAEGNPPSEVEITFIRPDSPEAQAWARHEGVPRLFITWSKKHRCEGAYKPTRWPPGHPNGSPEVDQPKPEKVVGRRDLTPAGRTPCGQ